MTYELAKQLKDAGFKTLMGFPVSNSDDGLYYPTLSELIEACSRTRSLFIGFSEHNNPLADRVWDAHCNAGGSNPTFFGHGSTPEEAVAKLWLKLNKK